MKSSLRLLLLGAIIAFGPAAQIDPSAEVKTMGRGLNILGYDPLWDDFAKARVHERHFRVIHEAGFRSLRLNPMAFDHMDVCGRSGWKGVDQTKYQQRMKTIGSTLRVP